MKFPAKMSPFKDSEQFILKVFQVLELSKAFKLAFWLVCYLPANSSLVFPKRQSQLISSETSLGKAKLPCPYPGRRGPLLGATQLPALPGDFPSVLADPQRSLGTPEPGEPQSTSREQTPLHELLEKMGCDMDILHGSL